MPTTDIDKIRKRPGMYIGDTSNGDGLCNMVFEITCYALREAIIGDCDRISVVLEPDGAITISDNGPGMPIESAEQGISKAELILTKFASDIASIRNSRKIPDQLLGAGAAVVNALSETFALRVWRDGTEYILSFKKGGRVAPINTVDAENLDANKKHGTEIKFRPDPSVFTNLDIDIERLKQRFQKYEKLNTSAKLFLFDRRKSQQIAYVFQA